MKGHMLKLEDWELEAFLLSGALDMGRHAIDLDGDDVVFIHGSEMYQYYGPFHIRTVEAREYYRPLKSTNQILCKLVEPLREIIYSEDLDVPVSGERVDEWLSRPLPGSHRESITGNREIDGLLTNCVKDSRRPGYQVLFDRDVASLVHYYSGVLNGLGIKHSIFRKKVLYIPDKALCERCLDRIDDTDDLHSIGSWIPNCSAIRGKPGRYAPSELQMMRTIRMPDRGFKCGMREGSSLIVIRDSYGRPILSPMCLNEHPVNEAIYPEDEEEWSTPSTMLCQGTSRSSLCAAFSMATEMFSMCGYQTDVVCNDGFHCHIVLRSSGRIHDVMLTPTIDEGLKEVCSIHDMPENTCVVLLKNEGPMFNIVKMTDITDCGFDECGFECKLMPLDINTLIPVEPALIREMKPKMDIIWSISL